MDLPGSVDDALLDDQLRSASQKPSPRSGWPEVDEDARQERILGSQGTGPSGEPHSDPPYNEETAPDRKYSRRRFTDPDELDFDTPEWRENVLTTPRSWQRKHSYAAMAPRPEEMEGSEVNTDRPQLQRVQTQPVRKGSVSKHKMKRSKTRRSSVFSSEQARGSTLGRLLSGMRRHSASIGESTVEEEENLWFTSMDDFNPPTFTLENTDTCTSYFVKASACKKNFVMKVYHKRNLTPDLEIQLRRCMSMIRTLHHPNIIRCLGVWETETDLFMVEEYCFHGDLFAQMVTNKRSLTEFYVANQVVKPLLDALVYLHSLGIAHRAIWPENLTFGRDGQLRLLNFLYAVSVWQNRPTSRHGYVDYMAPEVLRVIDPDKEDPDTVLDPSDEEEAGHGEAGSGRLVCYDEKVDIWQLGVLVYELLAGHTPFEVDDPTLTAALILWANVRKFPDTFSQDVISFIEDALVKDPSSRPSAEDLVNHPWLETAESVTSRRESPSPIPGLLSSMWGSVKYVLSAIARRVPRTISKVSEHDGGAIHTAKDSEKHSPVSPIDATETCTGEDDEVGRIMSARPLGSEVTCISPTGGELLSQCLPGPSEGPVKVAWTSPSPDILEGEQPLLPDKGHSTKDDSL
eukprot:evm.model.scf_1839.4 EVM.evm.TU.scf_1839.4   scf_1839:23580-31490(+)